MLFEFIDVKKEPFKSLYIKLAYLSVNFVAVPVWKLQCLLPSWRPRSNWSIERCIMVKRARFDEWLDAKVGGTDEWPSHKQLEVDNGVLGLWVQPVPELIIGKVKEWADFAGIKPIRIPGYWQHKAGLDIIMGEKRREGEKVIYFLHGGGYVTMSAHPKSPTSGIARAIMAKCPTVSRTFAIEYRLSSWDPKSRENPFPAALLDAIAGYKYLVSDVGFKSSDIVIVGDSAGGNLALTLARYLVDSADIAAGLPDLPAGLILLSPWTDLSGSHEIPGGSAYTCANTDFLAPPSDSGLAGDGRAYVGPHGMEFTSNAYVSPASKKLEHVSFKGFPRSFIVSGDAELLLDQIRMVKDRMLVDMGKENVTYLESEGAFHDFIGFPWFEPQRGEALEAIKHWIEGL